MSGINYPSESEEEVTEVYISVPDTKPKILNCEKVNNTNRTEPKYIILSIGNEPQENNNIYQPEDVRKFHARLKTTNIEFGIQNHLQDLETHDVNEKISINNIRNINSEFDNHIDNICNHSKRERANQLVETGKYGIELGFDHQFIYFKNGSKRNKNPSNESIDIVKNCLKQYEINTIACYRNAFEITRILKESSNIDSSRINYCEGFGLTKYGGVAQGHAWIEIDDQVIEVTWPWSGLKPSDKNMYYGFSIQWDKVVEKMNERPTYSSVVMPDYVYYSSPKVQKAIKKFS